MDAQKVRDSADELLLIARALPAKHKPALHRAARLLDSLIPKDERPKATGRYGGRPMPQLVQPSQDPRAQPGLF